MSKEGEIVKKPRRLTTKQAKFVKAKVEGKTGTQAAMEAYGVDYKLGSVMAAENMVKPSIMQALNAEFDRQGITLERIVAPINRALEAKKTVIHGKGDDGFADVVDDHGVQLKASAMAAQFIGIGKNPAEAPGGIHFHNHASEQKEKYDL